MNKCLGLMLTVVFLLAGCSDEEAEEIKSIKYYMENETALSERLEYCKKYPDKKLTDLNCVNALDANGQIKKDRMKKVGIAVDYSKTKSTTEKKKVSEKTNTKKFYMENESARTEKVKYCLAHPEIKYVEANCIKALAANTQLMKDRL